MPFNGTGTFNRVYQWLTDQANGIFIRADRMDQDSNDIATGLSNCMTKDGQQTPTANIKMGSFRLTGLGAGLAGTDAAQLGQVQAGALAYSVGGGTANAQTMTMTPTTTSLTDGQVYRMRATVANTGAATLTVDANTAYAILTPNLVALNGGEIIIGGMYEFLYNGNTNKFVILNPSNVSQNWCVAAGTAQAITGTNTPPFQALFDGMVQNIRFTAANTATAPTYAPDGLTAHSITKLGGVALVPADILNLMEATMRYNLANTRWELMDPGVTPGADPWVVAGGTADAITAAYSPAQPALYDGMLCMFRASAANATTTPTFSPNSLTAHTITKKGGVALAANDIPGALAEVILRYNLANTRWELLNPPATAIPSWLAIGGFIISAITGTHTTAGFSISAGNATDSTAAAVIQTSGATAWLASNGNAINGTDAASSTLANSTTYHVFMCSGASGTGSFVSASLTPTFPTGYAVYSRRIGSFTTTGAGAPIPYTVLEAEGGSTFNYLTTQVLDMSSVTVGTSLVSQTMASVPTGVKHQWLGRATSSASTGTTVLMTSGDETNVAPAVLAGTAVPQYEFAYSNATTQGQGPTSSGPWTTNTSAQIGFRASAASATVSATTRGWKDLRRA